MAEHNELGHNGEDAAEKYLIESGYRILERNSRWYGVEVDIIASQGNELVFVEVKTRTRNIVPLDKLFPANQRKRLIKAANFYVQKKNLDMDVRFDLILVRAKGTDFEIEHIKEAFHPHW